MTPEYLHFTSREDFDLWHDKVKQELGLPRVGVNAATGRPAPEKQQTTAYVEPEEHPVGGKGHVCRVDMRCPEKLRDKAAEKRHKLSRKTSLILEQDGWFKDRVMPPDPPSRATTPKTKA